MQNIAQQLKTKIERFALRLRDDHPLLTAANAGRVDPVCTAEYLASLRYLLHHTWIHLQAARQRAIELGDEPLARFFEKKSSEEVGHTKWAENDLEVIQRRFHLGPPEPLDSMRALVRYLAALAGEKPACYLGYVVFAEYFTVLAGPAWISALTDHCGIPAQALTCVTLHVELDKAHAAQGFTELNDLLRSQPDPSAIIHALGEAMTAFEAFFDELHGHSVPLQLGNASHDGARLGG